MSPRPSGIGIGPDRPSDARRRSTAVVPVKGFDAAKQRLGDALPAEGRADLVRAMLEDVLAALTEAGLDEILVVTPDRAAARLAEAAGAQVVREERGRGHTAAVQRGVAACRERGADLMLTVPGDLPCLSAVELRAILAACGPAPAAVFVPSRSGLGTNVACLAPPDTVPLRFGEPSFADHLAAARSRGIEPVVLQLAGAGLDIDRPEDLALLLAQGAGTRAASVLRAAGYRYAPPPPRVELVGIRGLPEIAPGDDLGGLVVARAAAQGTPLEAGDVLVVSQKVVSKAEGAIVRLDDIAPSPFAEHLAARTEGGKDPRAVEVILRETNRIVRMDRGHVICETRQGWVCANAGVDESNGVEADTLTLLPRDADASAARLCERFRTRFGVTVAVVVTDTFGRPWREGLIEVALGCAGMDPLLDLRGRADLGGRTLHHTVVALADEVAAAAGLVMEKDSGIPAAIVRGVRFTPGAGGAAARLVRKPEFDLFR